VVLILKFGYRKVSFNGGYAGELRGQKKGREKGFSKISHEHKGVTELGVPMRHFS
jgi:hypothetical protein